MISLTEADQKWATRLLAEKTWDENQGLPLCLLHPWDKIRTPHFELSPVELWDSIVGNWKGKFRFWQVGFENDSAIQGCEYYFFRKHRARDERRLHALTQQAQAFLGIDADAMVVAKTYQLPSHVLTISALRETTREATIQKVDAFFENLLRKAK